MQPETEREKQIAKSAFEAGMKAQVFNDKRDRMLDEGTKNCPCESSFETYIGGFEATKSQSNK